MEKDTVKTLSISLLITLFILCVMWKCLSGFDIDEQYSYSMMYRFLNGDIPIVSVFDSFQFSAWLSSPVYYISRIISEGYSVLFTRIISVLIYFLLSIRVYRFIERETRNKEIAVLTAICIYIVFPKVLICTVDLKLVVTEGHD